MCSAEVILVALTDEKAGKLTTLSTGGRDACRDIRNCNTRWIPYRAISHLGSLTFLDFPCRRHSRFEIHRRAIDVEQYVDFLNQNSE